VARFFRAAFHQREEFVVFAKKLLQGKHSEGVVTQA
jgi:hypothetical protein